jgi:hypothetical protein
VLKGLFCIDLRKPKFCNSSGSAASDRRFKGVAAQCRAFRLNSRQDLLLSRFRRGDFPGGGKFPLDLSDRATKIEACGWELGMKTILFGAYLIALGAGSALAANLPTGKAPPPVYPLSTPMWTDLCRLERWL